MQTTKRQILVISHFNEIHVYEGEKALKLEEVGLEYSDLDAIRDVYRNGFDDPDQQAQAYFDAAKDLPPAFLENFSVSIATPRGNFLIRPRRPSLIPTAS